MKKIIRKVYWNYEKEEKWLNEMAAKGMALTDYSWCRYVFEDSAAGEYTYRIELLEHLPTHAESEHYIRFMEENGVEHVASYMRWVYFRKKGEKPFDIFSDIDSRLKHYRRVSVFYALLAAAEMLLGLSNAIITIDYSRQFDMAGVSGFNIFAACFCFSIGTAVLLGIILPLVKKIKRLKREKEIRE